MRALLLRLASWIVPALPLVACGSSVVNSDGAGGTGGEGPGQLGQACAGATCADDLFCDFPDEQCGTNGAQGTCQTASLGASTDSPGTLCGCDGNIYSFFFGPQLAGVDAGELSLCPPPEGSFYCGSTVCDADAMTYCLNPSIDCAAQGAASCEILPPECVGSDDCSCFADVLSCSLRSDGVFELGCAP